MEKDKMTIIDVRTREEFRMGNAKGSINIPLQEIPGRVNEFKSFQGPVILVCASGIRSGQAALFLKSAGVDCENAGSWMQMNSQLTTV